MPLRVLIVDDDSLVRTTLSLMLEGAGHVVSTLESGFGLAVAFRSLRPDIVILDVNMPGLGGCGALRTARELCEDSVQPKVLLHSGRSAEELSEIARGACADGFLQKPASRSTVLAALDNASPHAA
ncbi:MAG: response regulator [Nannocystaceae bacterium]|nr:response regulator [bacterium]